MSTLASLDWAAVREHYNRRMRVHKTLLRLHREESISKFAILALGVDDVDGNYSAAEHGLGPKILHADFNRDAARRIFDLAGDLKSLSDGLKVPEIIANQPMKYLKIGIGSELSCMVNPEYCWVANTRTIWTHRVIRHKSISKADDELKTYREADVSSEMAYQNWTAIHAELGVALTRIAKDGRTEANKNKIKTGGITYIWADAIASALYEANHGQAKP